MNDRSSNNLNKLDALRAAKLDKVFNPNDLAAIGEQLTEKYASKADFVAQTLKDYIIPLISVEKPNYARRHYEKWEQFATILEEAYRLTEEEPGWATVIGHNLYQIYQESERNVAPKTNLVRSSILELLSATNTELEKWGEARPLPDNKMHAHDLLFLKRLHEDWEDKSTDNPEGEFLGYATNALCCLGHEVEQRTVQRWIGQMLAPLDKTDTKRSG